MIKIFVNMRLVEIIEHENLVAGIKYFREHSTVGFHLGTEKRIVAEIQKGNYEVIDRYNRKMAIVKLLPFEIDHNTYNF